jgi:release factor glutamine methyltransferase
MRAVAELALLALVREATHALEAAGLPDARQSAEWLLGAVAGGGRFGVYLDPGRELSPAQAGRYRDLVARRAAREPLQHLLGFEDFHGLRIAVTPDVLVPRPETEGLVQWAIEVARERPRALVADIGTGSGAIACALAARAPQVAVLAVDCSAAALAVARRNVLAHGLGDRVELLVGDLTEPLRARGDRCDVIVTNPPYLPSAVIGSLPAEVSRWEPRLALDGGPDGLAVIRRVIAEAPAVLAPGAWVLSEIGEDHAGPVASLLAGEGFADIRSRRDANGVERYIGGRWAAGPGRAR